MSFLRLQYTRSDGEVDTYHLKSGRRYNVGRGSACEVRILDMRLSRKHCAFEENDGTWMLSDLGSTNGCKINSERIEGDIPVAAPTAVTLGSVKIMIASISEHLADEQVKTEEAPDELEGLEESEDKTPSEETDSKDESSADYKTEINEEIEDTDENEDAAVEVEVEQEIEEEVEHEKEVAQVKETGTQTTDSSTEPAKDEYEPSSSSSRLKSIQSEKEQKVETKTVFISALGRKVGPITRTQARELKKCELKGKLTEDALEKIIGEQN